MFRWRKSTEVKNGVKKQVSKKMFPGYVLIHMIMNDDTWYVVRNTRGVTGFVGPGSKPVPLTEAEMRPLGIKTENVVVDFAEGDMIVVIGGVWKDTSRCYHSYESSQADSYNQCRTVRSRDTGRSKFRRMLRKQIKEAIPNGKESRRIH